MRYEDYLHRQKIETHKANRVVEKARHNANRLKRLQLRLAEAKSRYIILELDLASPCIEIHDPVVARTLRRAIMDRKEKYTTHSVWVQACGNANCCNYAHMHWSPRAGNDAVGELILQLEAKIAKLQIQEA